MTDFHAIDVESLLDHIRESKNGQREETPFAFNSGMSQGRIAIVGLADCGKRTLYNSLWGWDVLAGKYGDKPILNLGVFSLVDLPDNPHEADGLSFYPEDFDLIVYMIDASAGLRAEDFQWITRFRASDTALLLILNKIDRLALDVADVMIADVEQKLAAKVLCLNSVQSAFVHDQFLPAVLEAAPQLGRALACEIVSLRAHVVRYYIRDAVMQTGNLFVDGLAELRLEELLDIQRGLVRRIAEMYGYKNRQGDTYPLMLAHLGLRHAQRIFKPDKADANMLIWSAVGAGLTWLVGVAALYQFAPDRFLARWKKAV